MRPSSPVTGEGRIDSEEIASRGLIDQHYYSIANKAVTLKPRALAPAVEKQAAFKSKFGLMWSQVSGLLGT